MKNKDYAELLKYRERNKPRAIACETCGTLTEKPKTKCEKCREHKPIAK